MKKTLALLLALTLMMSVLVIPAAAATTLACPKCGELCVATKTSEKSVIRTVQSCSEKSGIHNHYMYYDVYRVNCEDHGYLSVDLFTHYVCP